MIRVSDGIVRVTGPAFISTWKTDNAGISSSTQITLPITTWTGNSYDFVVDWGDSTYSTITSANMTAKTHTYASAGTYTVKIRGIITGWQLAVGGSDRSKILNISQWGPFKFGNQGYNFYQANNLTITATDIPNLTGTENLDWAFDGCTSLTSIPNMGNWDVSAVTDMSGMFWGATAFSQDLSNWNVANVATMNHIFYLSGLNTFDYDAILISWSKQNPIARTFPIYTPKYSGGTAAARRSVLNGTYGWTISDGGQNASWPSSGAFTAVTNFSPTTFTLNWSAGSDAVTSTANLQYYVCSGATPLAIDTVTECLNATQEMNWTANTLTLPFTGKTAKTAYHYNVVMRDQAGDQVVYDGVSVYTTYPPTISAISDQVINENTNTGALPFTIADADDPVTCAGSVNKASSNITLVPLSNIVIAGTEPNCTVTVTPVADLHGISNITLTVTDGLISVPEVFQVTVNSLTLPSATFAINSGATSTMSTSVSLNLSDTTDVTSYRKADGADCSAASWINYSGAIAHTISGADGEKTVCLQVRNAALQVSTTETDTILLDTTKPVSQPVIANELDEDSTAGSDTTLSGTASDNYSGLASVSVSIRRGIGNTCLNNGMSDFNAACPNWITATGTTSWSLDIDDSVFTENNYIVTSRATDNYGNIQTNFGTGGFTWIIRDGIPPAAPLSLTANAVNLGVDLRWPATAGSPSAKGYILVRRSGSAVAWTPSDGTSYTTASNLDGGTHVIVYQGPFLNFSDANLNMGTTYHYALFAYDDDREFSPAVTASATVRKHIYRSVEPGNTSALTTGTSNALNITGTLATFAKPLPSNVGVGDALEYDYNNSGSINRIAFITRRLSPTKFLVLTAAGASPTATTANDNDWRILRAYTSLFNAESGVENTGINATVREFELFTNGRDIDTPSEIWNIALYGNGNPDTTKVVIDGWYTTTTHYLRVFAPHEGYEVGTSQKSQGRFTLENYYLVSSNGSIVTVRDNHVRIEGMQIYLSGVNGIGQATIQVDSVTNGHDIILKDNILAGAGSEGGSAGAYTYHTGILYSDASGAVVGTLRLINNIIAAFSAGAGGQYTSCITVHGPSIDLYAYNNTMYGCMDYGLFISAANNARLINNLIQFSGTGYYALGSPDLTGSSHNLTHDGTAPGSNAILNATVDFIEAGVLMLDGDDVEAKDAGLDLSNDTYYPFTKDVGGNRRDASWDIGGHEFQPLPEVIKLANDSPIQNYYGSNHPIFRLSAIYEGGNVYLYVNSNRTLAGSNRNSRLHRYTSNDGFTFSATDTTNLIHETSNYMMFIGANRIYKDAGIYHTWVEFYYTTLSGQWVPELRYYTSVDGVNFTLQTNDLMQANDLISIVKIDSTYNIWARGYHQTFGLKNQRYRTSSSPNSGWGTWEDTNFPETTLDGVTGAWTHGIVDYRGSGNFEWYTYSGTAPNQKIKKYVSSDGIAWVTAEESILDFATSELPNFASLSTGTNMTIVSLPTKRILYFAWSDTNGDTFIAGLELPQ